MLLSEKKLMIACIIFAAAGIAALFAVARVSEPLQISVSDVGSSRNSAKVKISGFIDSVRIYEGYSAIRLAGIEAVEAVSFDSEHVRRLGLQRFNEVEAYGELRDYKGKNSLILTQIKVLNRSLAFNCSGDGSGSH